MMPLFGGALTACTYHFFYNSPSLDALVALQVRLPDGANPWLSEATSGASGACEGRVFVAV